MYTHIIDQGFHIMDASMYSLFHSSSVFDLLLHALDQHLSSYNGISLGCYVIPILEVGESIR